MSDLGHAQLTRGPDSGPRNRILPDLVSFSPFPSPLPCFFVLEPPKRDLGTKSDAIRVCEICEKVREERGNVREDCGVGVGKDTIRLREICGKAREERRKVCEDRLVDVGKDTIGVREIC